MDGDEELQLSDLAPLFSETFDLADQVASQITPEQTKAALAAILDRLGYTSDGRPETD